MHAKIQHNVLTSLLPVQAGHEREGRRVRCPPHSCWGLRESGDVKKSIDYAVDALVVVFRKILFFVMVKVSQYYPTTLDIIHLRFHSDNEIM